MTLLQILTVVCAVVWLSASFVEMTRKGALFSAGDRIESHFIAAIYDLPSASLGLVYVYLLWFRGFVPRAVDHSFFDYFALAFGAVMLGAVLIGLYHFLAWLRLEAKGMEFGFGAEGPNGGAYRVLERRGPGNGNLDRLPRDERQSLETALAIKRKKQWQVATLALAGSILGTFFAYAYEPWIGWAAGLVALGPSAIWWLTITGEAVAYHLGAQFIPGAKVLEPELKRPGAEDVHQQKALGGARLATESETLAAAKDGGPRSRLHDQEF